MKGRLVLAGTPSELQSIRARKVIATALYGSIPLTLQDLNDDEAGQKSLVLTFHNDNGTVMIQLGTTNAMMRLIASLASPTCCHLLGKTWSDSAIVDGWVAFGWNSLEVPLECADTSSDDMQSAIQEDFGVAFTILDKHLNNQIYMVGDAITLADISLAFAVHKARAILVTSSSNHKTTTTTNMDRWLETMTNQEFFQRALTMEPVVGTVVR